MDLNSFLITTTNEIPGIDLYYMDIVSEVVEGYDMDKLLKIMEEKAKSMKAIAIIGFRTTAIYDKNNIKLMGYGTAVKDVEGQWAVY
ncbi:selenium-binding protein [Methanococcus aeolicus]|uniref:selenium-binding protein n=1 Tax=Methanococcus aeolicus TaxID=42879 RepID=UPI0021C9B02A|nr:selenium-binding protein [Methanococcus aeolicus]UXM84169.1 selenium-binding protein [Methanococcus aeolicus]